MNEEEIREVFDGIHMPPALLRKVENMNKNKNNKVKLAKTAAAVAAAFALCIAASNGICYAATGHTWISTVTMYINGKANIADVEWTKDGDTLIGKVEMPDDAESSSIMVKEFAAEGTGEEDVTLSETEAQWSVGVEDAAKAAALCEVKKEGEKVYLLVENGEQKIDITEDIADKEAAGEFTWKGTTYSYYVSGDAGEYELAVSTEK